MTQKKNDKKFFLYIYIYIYIFRENTRNKMSIASPFNNDIYTDME